MSQIFNPSYSFDLMYSIEQRCWYHFKLCIASLILEVLQAAFCSVEDFFQSRFKLIEVLIKSELLPVVDPSVEEGKFRPAFFAEPDCYFKV